MKYNMQAVYTKSDFDEVEKNIAEHIKKIKSKYKRVHKNNVLIIWDKIEIGISSVELHNLALKHGDYVTYAMNKEFDG